MSGIETIATIGGLAMQSLGAIGQASAQRSALRAQAQQTERQSQLMQLEAQRERELAEERARERGLTASARIARDVAAGGMRGTLVELGSPSLIEKAQRDLTRETLFGLRTEGDTRARMREWSASSLDTEAGGLRQAASQTVWRGLFGAATPWVKRAADKGDSDFAALRDWFSG